MCASDAANGVPKCLLCLYSSIGQTRWPGDWSSAVCPPDPTGRGHLGAPVPDRGAHHGGSHRTQAGPTGTAPLTPADPEQSARHHHQGMLAFLVTVDTAIIRDFLDHRNRIIADINMPDDIRPARHRREPCRP